MLKEITEGELRSPARVKATTDSPGGLFPTAAWRRTLGEYREIRKIPADFLEFIRGRLACTHHFLDQTDIHVTESVEVVMKGKHG